MLKGTGDCIKGKCMRKIHGGDIYTNKVKIDFSVNTNPLGIPKTVKDCLHEAVETCIQYPDIEAQNLKQAVADMLHIQNEYLIFGNGASELFMAIVHAIKPKKTVIPVPSFYGYEYAAAASGGEIIYYETKEETQFRIGDDFFQILEKDVDLLFLANPNNPTGNLIRKDNLRTILRHCKDKGIVVVLDECFIEFCDGECSIIQEIEQFENVILIRAFTKIFSIPGVRLGYLICSNMELLTHIKKQIPEWNLSNFAQMAGCACAAETEFIKKTVDYVKQERQFLEMKLRQLGIRVFLSEANFIFLYSEKPLYEQMLKNGILIRDCSNFRGLLNGFYRIAVKSREENEILLNRIGEIN